ncbi:uncharacterized protein [Drosophila pseudoobscura]|uniref:Uncharacterized protein n=1 Tax=Drosophila pseudoobscura pseudoobscura TaxID=46245 RepID=A0A6I8W8Z2_DROPS|nr:uncharacterized protein LOC117184869 [Drosophila pseudoobscura]
MEFETNNSASSTTIDKIEPSQAPVLNISGRREDTPRIWEIKKTADATDRRQAHPKINAMTFPAILRGILLKCSSPPPPIDPYNVDYTQSLCFLCLKKPLERKRLYHMFLSTPTALGKDYNQVNSMYSNRADFKIVNQITVNTFCARSLYRRVQKHFSDAVWNKKGNVFEMEMIADTDVWAISHDVYEMHNKEMEKLVNYINN